MKIKVKDKGVVEIKKNGVVLDVLKKLDLDENNILIVRQGELLVGQTKLEPGDELEILDVVSGG